MNTTEFRSDNSYEKYYNKFLMFFLNMPLDSLLAINLPIGVVCQGMLRAVPLVEPFREDGKKLPRFDFANFDNLGPLAFALSYANSLHSFEQSTPSELPKLVEEAIALTKTFDIDIAALVRHKLLGAVEFPVQQGTVAYKNVALDLLNRTSYLKTNWKKIDGNTGLRVADVNLAVDLCGSIQHTLAVKDLAPNTTAAEVRQRAYTAGINDYAEVRRAILFLDKANVETIIPSLYALGRAGSKSSEHSGADTTDDDPTEVTPANVAASPAPVAVDAKKVSTGGPGGNPFMD